MKWNNLFIAPLLVVALLTGMSCKSYNEKQLSKETATRGDIRIAVDESYKLLVDSQIATFTSIYKYAHITPMSASEDSVLKLFLADSVRLMITSRKLTANEEEYLKGKLIVPRTTQIAWDGIAFIVNKANRDSFIRYNTLKEIFSNSLSSWKQINPSSRLGKIRVVFDNQGSGNIRYIMKKFNISTLPDFCYAANSNPAVIDYVESHPNALGIISVNWISDPDDSITHAFLSRIKVIGVTPEVYSEGDDFYTPHPAYIADKSYPFIREVYAISRETFTGLGRGFIQFVAGDKGQRIVLKSGMVPATMPVRIVQIRKE
jgi:phosphate transport system substrate-binding protein